MNAVLIKTKALGMRVITQADFKVNIKTEARIAQEIFLKKWRKTCSTCYQVTL